MAAKDPQVMKMDAQKFTWRIENFSMLKESEICSDTFLAGGHSWRIFAYPNGSDGYPDYLSVYVNFVDWGTMPEGGSVPAVLSLTLVDQLNGTSSVRKCSGMDFGEHYDPSWGFDTFVALDDIHDSHKGFLVDDTLVIEAGVCTEAAASEATAEPNVGVTSSPFSLSEAELASRSLIAQLSSMTVKGNSSSSPDYDFLLLQHQREKLVGFLGMSLEAIHETESLDRVDIIARFVADHAATDPHEKAVLKELISCLGEFKEVVPSSLAAIESSNFIESSVAQMTKGLEVRKFLCKKLLSSLVTEAYRLGKEGMKLEAEIQQLSVQKTKILDDRNSVMVELEKANQEASELLEKLEKQREESNQAVENRLRAQAKLAKSNSSWKLLKVNLGW